MANKESWKQKEWSDLYKNLYFTLGPVQAGDQAWAEWNSNSNRYKDEIKDKNQFLLFVATYRDRENIGTAFVIEYDSEPIYDTWTNYVVNWIDHWELEHWKLWWIELKAHFGLVEAQKRFINAWNYPDNWSYGMNWGIGHQGAYDCDFLNYFRHQGIDLAMWGAENLCTLVDTGSNLIDATENISEGIKKTSGFVGTVLPYLLMIGATVTIYAQVKKFNE
jgi:hypothetical protein